MGLCWCASQEFDGALSRHEAHAGFLARAASSGVELITADELWPASRPPDLNPGALASAAGAHDLVARWHQGAIMEALPHVEPAEGAPMQDEFEGMD